MRQGHTGADYTAYQLHLAPGGHLLAGAHHGGGAKGLGQVF